MKKMTLFAAIAAFAMSANAQYTVDPSLDNTKNNGEVFDIFLLDGTSVSTLEAAGKTVHKYFLDPNEGRNLWWWAGWDAGDSNYPGVDFQTEGYVSLQVTGTAGWSGGGFNQNNKEFAGMDLSHVTNDTRLHIALRTPGTAPASLALIFFDGEGDCGSLPAKVSFGKAAFEDNGAVFPLVGNFDEGGDWVGIDIKFSDLKKLYPAFDFKAIKNWGGNYCSILSGNVAGTSFSIDAFYLYGPKTNGTGIQNATADKGCFLVTSRTINANGTDAGIELYNLNGQLVKSTTGCVMGIEDAPAGVYIVKSGELTKKITLK